MGGRARSVAARIVARQEFAGYWEYLLEEAIFTAPGHPLWGGAALIGSGGELLGIGSLQLQHATPRGGTLPVNMIVPIDLLTPILEDMTRLGPNRPARPWLGLYATEPRIRSSS
jgi:S1-C subfamily serine protease